LKITLPLLRLHRAIGIVVDDSSTPLRGPRDHNFLHDLFQTRGRGAHGTGTGHAPEAAESTQHPLDFLAWPRAVFSARREEPVEEDDLPVACHDVSFACVIQRVDGNFLEIDVLPDVELRPIRQRKDANRLFRADPAVVEIPEFGALILWVPLTELVSEGKETLLCTGLLFVAPRAANRRIEVVVAKSGQESFRLEKATAPLRAKIKWVRAVRNRGLIPPHD